MGGREARVGKALVLFAASSFAFKGIIAKLGYAAGVTVLGTLFYRFLFAAPIYLLFADRTRESKKLSWSDYGYLFLAAALFCVSAWADFVALSLIDASVERVILFSYPAFVVLGTSLRDKKYPSRGVILNFCLTELGIFIVMGGNGIEPFMKNLEGNFWALFTAVTYALYLLVADNVVMKLSGSALAGSVNLIAFLAVSGVIAFTAPETPLVLSGEGYLYMAIIGVFCTALPFLALFGGIRRIGSEKASLLSMIGPVVTITAAALILGERLSLIQLLGAAIVFIGVFTSGTKPKNLGLIVSAILKEPSSLAKNLRARKSVAQ